MMSEVMVEATTEAIQQTFNVFVGDDLPERESAALSSVGRMVSCEARAVSSRATAGGGDSSNVGASIGAAAESNGACSTCSSGCEVTMLVPVKAVDSGTSARGVTLALVGGLEMRASMADASGMETLAEEVDGTVSSVGSCDKTGVGKVEDGADASAAAMASSCWTNCAISI